MLEELNRRNREHQRNWMRKNREKKKAEQRVRYHQRKGEPAHQRHLRRIALACYYRNHEARKEANRQWRLRNLGEIRARYKKFYEKNRERLIARSTAYAVARYKKDPLFRFKMCLRSRIRLGIKAGKGRKWNRTVNYLGGTFEQTRSHIESRFKPGMSWENHGTEWEIDHAIPVASFDMTQLEEQLQCFHFKNLQPLWKKENRAKGKKLL